MAELAAQWELHVNIPSFSSSTAKNNLPEPLDKLQKERQPLTWIQARGSFVQIEYPPTK